MEEYSLRKFFKSPIPTKYLPYVQLGLSLLGFLDATYLTIVHYRNLIPPCTIGGCEVVLTSKYSTIGSVPIALIGSAFYLIMVVFSAFFIQSKRSFFVTVIFVLTTCALVISAVLVYLQAGVLHAFCQYCLTSEAINFLLFDTAWFIWYNLGKE